MENFTFSVKHSNIALDSQITTFQINCLQNCLIKTIYLLQKILNCFKSTNHFQRYFIKMQKCFKHHHQMSLKES